MKWDCLKIALKVYGIGALGCFILAALLIGLGKAGEIAQLGFGVVGWGLGLVAMIPISQFLNWLAYGKEGYW